MEEKSINKTNQCRSIIKKWRRLKRSLKKKSQRMRKNHRPNIMMMKETFSGMKRAVMNKRVKMTISKKKMKVKRVKRMFGVNLMNRRKMGRIMKR